MDSFENFRFCRPQTVFIVKWGTEFNFFIFKIILTSNNKKFKFKFKQLNLYSNN
jgi:hypothetical protein